MDYLDAFLLSLIWTLYAPDSPYPAIMALVIGLETGSFLNVVIYRLPVVLVRWLEARRVRSLGVPAPRYPPFNPVVPPSRCPSCGHRITWWENIPVVSYCLLKGRCRCCLAPIPVSYVVVELLTGVSFACVFARYGLVWATVQAWAAIFLAVALAGLSRKWICRAHR